MEKQSAETQNNLNQSADIAKQAGSAEKNLAKTGIDAAKKGVGAVKDHSDAKKNPQKQQDPQKKQPSQKQPQKQQASQPQDQKITPNSSPNAGGADKPIPKSSSPADGGGQALANKASGSGKLSNNANAPNKPSSGLKNNSPKIKGGSGGLQNRPNLRQSNIGNGAGKLKPAGAGRSAKQAGDTAKKGADTAKKTAKKAKVAAKAAKKAGKAIRRVIAAVLAQFMPLVVAGILILTLVCMIPLMVFTISETYKDDYFKSKTTGDDEIDACVVAFNDTENGYRTVGGMYASVTGVAYADWMIDIANNHPEVGYSQRNRNYSENGYNNYDVDCSSFIYYALLLNGYPNIRQVCNRPFSTRNMGGVLLSLGFEEVTDGTLRVGDILVEPGTHTEVYIGDGQNVAAWSDENRDIVGIQPGDQTGLEVLVAPFWSGYTHIYRDPNPPRTSMVACAMSEIETSDEYALAQAAATWTGRKLDMDTGTIQGPTGKETWYDQHLDDVIYRMRWQCGNYDPYWIRSDGVRMLGNYVIVAADLKEHPRGTLVECSLGMAIVCDTGGFVNTPQGKTWLDIAVNWESGDTVGEKDQYTD